MAKNQNHSISDCLEEFIIPPLHNIVDGDQDEMLLCPIRGMKKYLSRTEKFRPACKNLLRLHY